MDIHKLRQMSESERNYILQNDSEGREEQTYMKPLNDDEMLIIKEELAANSIAKAYIDDEFKQVKEAFKDKLEPITKKISSSIESLRNKSEARTGFLWKMVDLDNRQVYFLDDEGNVISSRMMKPEERQFRIQGTQKTA